MWCAVRVSIVVVAMVVVADEDDAAAVATGSSYMAYGGVW